MASSDPIIKFFTNSKAERIAYAVHGNGPVLVVPAWWVSHVELDWNIEAYQSFFSRLGQHFSVIRYDRPGAGLSDRSRKCFSLSDEVENLSELIEHLKIRRCSLLGISCGGPPCIAYAYKNSAQVKEIIFISSYLNGKSIANNAIQTALSTLVKAHWGLGAKAILDLFSPAMSAAMRQQISQIHKQSASAEMAAALLELSFNMDATAAAKALSTPSLVIHHQHDKTIAFALGRDLAAHLNNAQFISIDDKAHLPWMSTQNDKIIAAILHFCDLATRPQQNLDTVQQFKQLGDSWALSYAGKTSHLKDSRGLNDIAYLIRNQAQEVHVNDLISQAAEPIIEAPSDILDQQAISQYRQRLEAINIEQQQAALSANDTIYAQLETEQEAILHILKQGLGLAGRPRKFTNKTEKARKAVSARIRASIKKIAVYNPELAQHLRSSIKTGLFCSYTPTQKNHWLS